MTDELCTQPPLETRPFQPSPLPLFTEQPAIRDLNMDLLKEQNPCPKQLIYLFKRLSVELNDDIMFNSDWNVHMVSLRFCAQSVINRCDENARPAFELFKAAGLKVMWPNVFKRAWFAFQRIRREATQAKRHEAEAEASKVRLSEEDTKRFATLAQMKMTEAQAEKARCELRIQSEKKLQLIIATREAEKCRKRENGSEIIKIFELIEERKKEGKKEDGTNNLIRRYNALVEMGDHNLNQEEWTKIKYLSLNKE